MSIVQEIPTSPTVLAEPELPAPPETLADLVSRLGDVPLHRIRTHPAMGTATEEDLLAAGKPFCEFINGILDEKPMGFFEGRLAFILGIYVEQWLSKNNIGFAMGDGGYTRLDFGLIRIPDFLFVNWNRLPSKTVPRDAISKIPPNLAVEILSPSNTRKEMDRKREEYFQAGVELVWIVNPETRVVEVWSTAKDCHLVGPEDILDGGTVLPGFSLSIADWFQRASTGTQPAP